MILRDFISFDLMYTGSKTNQLIIKLNVELYFCNEEKRSSEAILDLSFCDETVHGYRNSHDGAQRPRG